MWGHGLRAGALIFAALFCCTAPAGAQPAPDTLISSTLTRAQADELNRRLTTLQGRFTTLAREADLRAGAVRNIAVEIFGAQPNLDFETYAGLIETGVRELQGYIVQARGRVESDPALSALRSRALAAAEDGRLTDARTLYDEMIEAARTLRTATRRAEDLADAADRAEAARLSLALADYRDAARRFGQAADAAPADARERWQYLVSQAGALRDHGAAFGDNAARAEALRILRERALPMTPRDSNPADWVETQLELADALYLAGYYGDQTALADAVATYSAIAEAFPRADWPEQWARAQHGLGNAYIAIGRRDAAARPLAVAAYSAALEERTREAHPQRWASSQLGLGIAYGALGDFESLRRGEAALNAALEVQTRADSPLGWARIISNLADLQRALGDLGFAESYRAAVASYLAALEIYTEQSAPNFWAGMQTALGHTYLSLARYNEPGAAQNGIAAFTRLIEVRGSALSAEAHASAQYALGQGYTALYRQGDAAAAPLAVRAFEASLLHYTRESDPIWWAHAQTYMGLALRRMGEDGDERALARSIEAMSAALAVRTREAHPTDWAANQYSIGLAHRVYVQRGDRRHLAPALTALRASLEEYEHQGNTYWPGLARQWIAELEALQR